MGGPKLNLKKFEGEIVHEFLAQPIGLQLFQRKFNFPPGEQLTISKNSRRSFKPSNWIRFEIIFQDSDRAHKNRKNPSTLNLE